MPRNLPREGVQKPRRRYDSVWVSFFLRTVEFIERKFFQQDPIGITNSSRFAFRAAQVFVQMLQAVVAGWGRSDGLESLAKLHGIILAGAVRCTMRCRVIL